MRGHVAKKGSRYYAVIYEGSDPKTGRSRYRWHAGGSTRTEAEKVLANLVKRVHDGDYRAPDRITLRDYLQDRWIPMKRAQIKHSTWDQYRRNVLIHVVLRIGHIPLQWSPLTILRYLGGLKPGHPDVYTELRTRPRRQPVAEIKNMTLRMDESLADSVQAIAEVEGTTATDVIRTAISEHVDRRKADPEFQKMLKRNMERHAQLLSMLADG